MPSEGKRVCFRKKHKGNFKNVFIPFSVQEQEIKPPLQDKQSRNGVLSAPSAAEENNHLCVTYGALTSGVLHFCEVHELRASAGDTFLLMQNTGVTSPGETGWEGKWPSASCGTPALACQQINKRSHTLYCLPVCSGGLRSLSLQGTLPICSDWVTLLHGGSSGQIPTAVPTLADELVFTCPASCSQGICSPPTPVHDRAEYTNQLSI